MPELTVAFAKWLAQARPQDHARHLWAETAAPLPAAAGCEAVPCGFQAVPHLAPTQGKGGGPGRWAPQGARAGGARIQGVAGDGTDNPAFWLLITLAGGVDGAECPSPRGPKVERQGDRQSAGTRDPAPGMPRTHSRVRPARGPGQRRAPSGGQLQGSGQRASRSPRGSDSGSSSSSPGSGRSAGDRHPMAGEPECGSGGRAARVPRTAPAQARAPLPAPWPSSHRVPSLCSSWTWGSAQ